MIMEIYDPKKGKLYSYTTREYPVENKINIQPNDNINSEKLIREFYENLNKEKY